MNHTIKCLVITVAALLFAGGCGSRHYSPASTLRLPSSQSGVVKAMTFNIRTKTFLDGLNGWNHRKHVVIDMLEDNAPDVFGLQEARYSQYSHIRQSMPRYGSYAAGRNNGRESGESCPIFYRKDRFTLADAGTFWFSDTPSVPGSKDWGNMPPRICTWAHLIERSTGTGLYVYNVHLDHLSQRSRAKSVQLLAQKVNVRKAKDPFIVMGDFNMKPNNPAMRYLDRVGQTKQHVKNADAWQLIHPGRSIGTRHGFRGALSGPQIDHIRISSNLRALDARIDHRHDGNGRYPSDHFPVIAKILLTPVPGREYTRITDQPAVTPSDVSQENIL